MTVSEPNTEFLLLVAQYHRTAMGKELEWKKHKFLIDMYLDGSRKICLMKSTQCGISEYLIARAIWESHRKRNILYVLPNESIKARFVQARFNRVIQETPYYGRIIKSIKSKILKDFGGGIINFIGSISTSGFTEFVAHSVYIDELDECDPKNVEMSSERQSSFPEEEKFNIKVSNPKVSNFGISYEYNKSDKKKWFVKCDSCGEYVNPDFFRNVVLKQGEEWVLRDEDYDREDSRDIAVICDYCHKPINRFGIGEWVKEDRFSDVSGYHISKLFSTETSVKELVERFNEGLVSEIKMQRFYNGDLGLPFESSGAKLLPEDINKAKMDYLLSRECKNPCVMGIDVGGVLNVVIGELIRDGTSLKIRIVHAGTTRCNIVNERIDISEIKDLFLRYNIIYSVIDMRPETRMSRMLKATFKAMWGAEYLNESNRDVIDLNNKIIKMDRTVSLDSVREHVLTKDLLFPKDIDTVKDFTYQMTISTRYWEENRDGTGRFIWIDGGNPDHYFHACNYMLMAKKLVTLQRG